MSDAPETIWAWDDLHHVETNPYNSFAVEYRRADLPPTTAQIIDDELVKALVELINRASAIIDPCYPEKHHTWQKDASALLAQLKELTIMTYSSALTWMPKP